jgi:DNA-binding transcriptional regulator YdaS (Cro superfamily)
LQKQVKQVIVENKLMFTLLFKYSKEHQMNARKVVSFFGGGKRLADLIGDITPQAISMWKQIPVKRVIQIEKLSGGKFTREQMRPDIYQPKK